MSKSKEILNSVDEQGDKVLITLGNELLKGAGLKVKKFLPFGGKKGLQAEFTYKEDGKTYTLVLKEK